MRILLSGGGTAGSVSPLIAITRQLSRQNHEVTVLFVGTRQGNPERQMLQGMNIAFKPIFSGKFRRYFDPRNLIDPFLILIGFIQSFFIISKFDPDIIIGAGGYVSVPVIWAGWVMKKKIIIHQQDIKPSLSNILTMNLADAVTTAFVESVRFFPKNKTQWIGNPSRIETYDVNSPLDFTIDESLPLVVIVGGGTGSDYINAFVRHHFDALTRKYFIIHITGLHKGDTSLAGKNYRQFELLGEQLLALFKKATVVISRAGLSTLTELSLLSKPSIIIPLSNSHQVMNAKYFLERNAIEYHDQAAVSDQRVMDLLDDIVSNPAKQAALSRNIGSVMKKNACSAMMTLINKMANHEPTSSS